MTFVTLFFVFFCQGEDKLRGVSITDLEMCKKYHRQNVFTDVRSNGIRMTVIQCDNCRVHKMDREEDCQQWGGKAVSQAVW